MNLKHSLFVAAILAGLLPPSTSAALQEFGKPAAVVVAFRRYQTLTPLEHTLDSATNLATALNKVGYSVTLVTEDSSVEDANKAVDSSSEIIVQACNTEAELDQFLLSWREHHFVKDTLDDHSETPFGFICFSGHGQRRNITAGTVDFLLTPDAELHTGGISVNQLRADIGRKRLPIVLILDCCRTYVAQAERGRTGFATEATNSPQTQPGSRIDQYDRLILDHARSVDYFRQVREYPNPVSPVTTYWATLPGNEVADRADADFFSWLAEGLQWNSRARQFYARERRASRRREPNSLDDCPLEGRSDLSLASWFKYAAGQQADATGGLSAWPEAGYVDEIMICASRKREYQRPPLSLTASWNDFPTTPTSLATATVPRGMRISRPDATTSSGNFAVSFFTDRDAPLEWKDSSLIIDVLAEAPPFASRQSLSCLIQPGDNRTLGSYLTRHHDRPYRLPFGVRKRIRIPLEGADSQALTSLAISTDPQQPAAWSEDASVTVSRLLLVSNEDLRKVGQRASSAPVNLMTRWWDLDPIPAANVSAVERGVKVAPGNPANRGADGRRPVRPRYLRLEFDSVAPDKPAGRGGPVYAPPHVNTDHHQLTIELRRVVRSAEDVRDRHLTLRVHDRHGRRLMAANVDNRSRKPQKFSFEHDGFADYLTLIGEGIAAIEIETLEILPVNR